MFTEVIFMMKKAINWFSGCDGMKNFLIILVAVVLVVGYFVLCPDPTKVSFGEEYELSTKDARIVRVAISCPNVRSEPVANRFGDETNSFGSTKETNFTIEVTRLYTTDRNLDENGPYYGLKVREILNNTEGEKWFPKGIKKDPDGIVWINSRYLEIVC